MRFLLWKPGRLTTKSYQNTFSGKYCVTEKSHVFRLEGTSGCPSHTCAPRRASCEVRPSFLGLHPGGPRNPSRGGACHTWAICICLLPAWPHGKVSVHSLNNPPHFPSCLEYLALLHRALEKPICPSTSLYTPSHCHGSDVLLKLFLLQAGQAPLPQDLGQCSQDTLRSWELWGWTHFRLLVFFPCWRALN